MSKKEKISKYFAQKNKLSMNDKNYFRQVKFLFDFFLREDLAGIGDITSNLFISEKSTAIAEIIVKKNGILAGLQEAKWFLRQQGIKFQTKINDGDKIKKGQIILKLSGKAKKILMAERTLLNVLQRMSGIASATAELVKKVNNKVLICPTRKTQWGLLDKRAVVCGGGGTHRLGLYDFILIKENHFFDQNNLTNKLPKYLTKTFWEIEVENEKQALEIARLNPSAIMFDDFAPLKIKEIIKKIKKISSNIIFEASGGINEKNISQYANTGVDIISLGALTHSAKALDISLNLIPSEV
jgi:nicotinate-nucleotide pyrophosphorylase (carboxylating)